VCVCVCVCVCVYCWGCIHKISSTRISSSVPATPSSLHRNPHVAGRVVPEVCSELGDAGVGKNVVEDNLAPVEGSRHLLEQGDGEQRVAAEIEKPFANIEARVAEVEHLVDGLGFVNICMHTCIHAYIHMHTCIHTRAHAYMHTCIHTHTHAYMHTCTYTYTPWLSHSRA